MVVKNHFNKKGFALGLVLKQRPVAFRKWPIARMFGARYIDELISLPVL